jgi:hypothetical protein
MKKSIALIAALVALAMIAGCETFHEAWDDALNKKGGWTQEAYKPKYVIGIFRYVKYPRAGELEKEISTIDGRKFWINTVQLFSSQNIKEIRLLPRLDRPDKFDIAINLDARGVSLWTLMATEYRDQPLAVMIDSLPYDSFVPQPLSAEGETWVTLASEKSFDEVTAAGLQKFAKENYKHFNPSPTKFFE